MTAPCLWHMVLFKDVRQYITGFLGSYDQRSLSYVSKIEWEERLPHTCRRRHLSDLFRIPWKDDYNEDTRLILTIGAYILLRRFRGDPGTAGRSLDDGDDPYGLFLRGTAYISTNPDQMIHATALGALFRPTIDWFRWHGIEFERRQRAEKDSLDGVEEYFIKACK
jgi:hypothetical protein